MRSLIYQKLLFFYLLFLVFFALIPGKDRGDFIIIILTVASFLFAILLGFITANRRKRLEILRTNLRSNDAKLLSIYCSSKLFGKAVIEKCRKLIDNYLLVQLDYRLTDYNKSTPAFIELYNFILSLKPKNQQQANARDHMVSSSRETLDNQKEIIYAVKDTMLFFEWAVLVMLTLILIVSLIYINAGTLFAIITLPLLSLALVLLLFILQDLDSLRWQEDSWIWVPLTELFTELDLLPYVPEHIISHKRKLVKKTLENVKKYRSVSYPNKYPDFTGKKITVVKN